MGGGVERDLMSGGSSLRDEGKIFFVVAGGDYKEGRLYSGTVQRGQNVRRRLAGAVVEGQTDPLLGHRLRLRGRFYRGRRGRGDEAFVRHRGQVALPAAYGRLCTAEYPQSEPRRRPDRKQQKAPQQSLMFAGFEKSHFQKPPS